MLLYAMQARRPRIFVLLPTMPPPTMIMRLRVCVYEGFMHPHCVQVHAMQGGPGSFVLLTTMPPPTDQLSAGIHIMSSFRNSYEPPT